MHFLVPFRFAALGVPILFSVIIIGLAAHLTWYTTTNFSAYFTFAAFGIAVSVMTLLTFPALLAIDLLRKGALTSMIMVELAILSLFWILWLASAGVSADANARSFNGQCSGYLPEIETFCREFSAITAFSFLNWLILLVYILTLLTFAVISATRGHQVWKQSVSQTDFNAPRVHNEKFPPGGVAQPYQVPQQTGPYQVPQQTGPYQVPQQTGPYQVPQQTGPYQTPQHTGQYQPSPVPDQSQLPPQQYAQQAFTPPVQTGTPSQYHPQV